MGTAQLSRATIYAELTSDDSDVRASFIKAFGSDVNAFVDAMADAAGVWREIDNAVSGDVKKGYIAAIAYAAINLHIVSLKLFLSGHIVAAGNLMRQVIESIALAVLCSAKNLDVLPRFMEGRYSANDAVRDLVRQAKLLALNTEGLVALKSSRDFYHKFSHLSRLTLASMVSFSERGIYCGASFDEGKIGSYRKEMAGRVSLAKVLPNILQGVRIQLGNW